ncbi:MAG: hypothetical protein WCY01_00525 [Alkalispirochaeta sp.]
MATEAKFPERAPNCLQCKHFTVTWNPRFPRGCTLFEIKTRRLPSIVVYENTGYHCPGFEYAPGHTPNGRDPGQMP